jgi:hypothetical protein
MWFYVGLGMFAVGLTLLSCFGITQEEHKQGKPYAASDRVGSVLFVLGCCITGATVVWWFVQFLVSLAQQLFYGVEAAYADTPLEPCALVSFSSALFFLLALLACFRAEGQFRQYRRTDHAHARRIRARHFHYAGVLIWCGQLALLSSVLLFVLKRL